ncbi:hypothetical protein Pst134EA_032307 [Puccinia striiformis f. sp. tritici]|uniref:uncharacterized protein n=1 Tax=Puccinia striiformis f. sp. tritici TaxID=168172 RepID=UPI0020089507|nr:uncharacterized protein Pst134EA_032307 [Puccinia striiformis f. sp. tritici]KAH9440741.1 hypothetical protein Pst134EA_032307 [Puccinia striiformis f. sp. tritici]KAH9466501.1 hypothetical protein Pst134EB_001554 [Puccinia striiformis f. sp. tritici]
MPSSKYDVLDSSTIVERRFTSIGNICLRHGDAFGQDTRDILGAVTTILLLFRLLSPTTGTPNLRFKIMFGKASKGYRVEALLGWQSVASPSGHSIARFKSPLPLTRPARKPSTRAMRIQGSEQDAALGYNNDTVRVSGSDKLA